MGPPPGLFAELSRWRSKASQRGKVTEFTSEIIPTWLNDELMAAQETIGVDAAFSFMKQTDAQRMRRERELAEQLEEQLAEFEREAMQAIEEEREPDWEALALLLGAVLIPFLQSLAVEEALAISTEMGVMFDPAIISQEALSWARSYSYELISGLTDTTRNVVSNAMQAYIETPGMTQEALRAMLEQGFSPARAQMIATTETTRAYSAAMNQYQRLMSQSGVQSRRVWQTMEDERVCVICGPLHDQPEQVWSAEFPDGPPAHVNCRCGLSLEVINA